MIQAIGVNRLYESGTRQLHVLKDINVHIEAAEFVVIVGPSGAGKSTLLHILGGLDVPTSGKVILDKNDLYEIGESRLAKIRNTDIGFVFQFYHLMPEFNVLENVLMPAMIMNQGSAAGSGLKEKAKGLLTKVGMADRMSHKPNQLSGGEQQRVAIARALINSPKVLFCDEPTGNLDSETGLGVMELLSDLNKKESVTCLMVTHQESLVKGAGRILYMKDGEIQKG
jgi:lipoprotein-releasing system ATP-binding protein